MITVRHDCTETNIIKGEKLISTLKLFIRAHRPRLNMGIKDIVRLFTRHSMNR